MDLWSSDTIGSSSRRRVLFEEKFGCGLVSMSGLNLPEPSEGKRYSSWEDLVGALVSNAKSGLLFRGMPCAGYRCVTSLERALVKSLGTELYGDPVLAGRYEQGAISNFRAAAHPYLQVPPPPDDLLSWLCLMQHYGAPTRLLDWTESPLVACYFAYRNMPDSDAEGAVWVLDGYQARQKAPWDDVVGRDDFQQRKTDRTKDGQTVTQYGPREKDWNLRINDMIRELVRTGFGLPFPVVPQNPDQRMVAQQTVLTIDAKFRGGIGFPDALVAGLVDRVLLPSAWRTAALSALSAMGVTDASMFPGLEGIARDTCLRTELKQLTFRSITEIGPFDPA